METLEQRVERLERSCRRWQLGFLILAAIGLTGAATMPSPNGGAVPDAQFAHLTVKSLTIRGEQGGAFLSAGSDKSRAWIKLASPVAGTVVAIVADAAAANVFLSHSNEKGLSSAAVSADKQSGIIDLQTAAGKSKEIEPE